MQIIKVDEQGHHSIKHYKLLGFYEGKDNQQNRPTKSTGPWDRWSQKKLTPAENFQN